MPRRASSRPRSPRAARRQGSASCSSSRRCPAPGTAPGRTRRSRSGAPSLLTFLIRKRGSRSALRAGGSVGSERSSAGSLIFVLWSTDSNRCARAVRRPLAKPSTCVAQPFAHSGVQPAKEGLNGLRKVGFLVHQLIDPLLGVDHRGVILAAELLADDWIRKAGD